MHISRPLPRDSQIISLPWHGTSSTALGCLMEHDTASACVHVAERPRPPAISTSCRMQNLRAMLAACYVNTLPVFEKAPCMFWGTCGLHWFFHSVQILLACVLKNPFDAGSCEDHLNSIPNAFNLLRNCWKSIFFFFFCSFSQFTSAAACWKLKSVGRMFHYVLWVSL